MNTKYLLYTCITASALVAATSVQALVIAEYSFDEDSFASSDAGTNWTTTDLGSGGGVPLATDDTEGQPAPSLAFEMGDINDGTFLDDDYYTFTVTPSSSLDFTTFTFDINKISGGADVEYQLFSSVDGFTAGNELGSGAISDTDTWLNESTDVSSLTAVSSTTEFRLYFFTTGTFGPNQIKVDNITLSAVPEPSAFALLAGCFGLTWVMLRRRAG